MLAVSLALSLSVAAAPTVESERAAEDASRPWAEGLAMAAVGGASLATFALEKRQICDPGMSGCGGVLFMLHFGVSSVAAPLVGWGVHRALDGRGAFQDGLKAYLLAETLWPLLFWIVTDTNIVAIVTDAIGLAELPPVAGLLVYGIPGVALGAALGAALLELSDQDARGRWTVRPWLAPGTGGILVARAF